MIEIILLYFLCKRIGRLAREKKESPRRWQGLSILIWFSMQFMGYTLFIAGTGITDPTKDVFHLLMMTLFGLGFGYLGFLFLEGRLKGKDVVQNGQNENPGI